VIEIAAIHLVLVVFNNKLEGFCAGK